MNGSAVKAKMQSTSTGTTMGYEFKVVLTLAAPFLFKADESLQLGSDAATLTDELGKPIIPGTHIKGHLRQALLELGQTEHLLDWFGAESSDGDEPSPGLLTFDEHWLSQESPSPSCFRHRIQIHPETGAVVRGALQVIEQTHPSGSQLKFSGCIRASTMVKQEAEQVRAALQLALAWIPALGALKGVGFGRVVAATQQIASISVSPLQVKTPRSTVQQLNFQLDRAYCFGSRVIADNRFESTVHVPGAALRAALFACAKRLEKLRVLARNKPALEKQLDPALLKHAKAVLGHAAKIRFTHAWPDRSDVQRRPGIVPHSALMVAGHLFDASHPALRQPVLVNGQAPAFSIDWKHQDSKTFAELQRQPALPSSLIVRTAIATDSGAAAEGKLFALDCFVPQIQQHLNQSAEPAVFRSMISLDCPPKDCEPLWAALAALLPLALSRLGKTEARAQKLAFEQSAAPTLESVPQHGELVLCLQSDALLGDAGQFDVVNGADCLRETYTRYFDAQSNGAVVLVDYFARQRWVGGGYYQNRFWRGQDYRARLLTEAGSVFVLRVIDSTKAPGLVNQWLGQGLPPAEDSEHWEKNPYIRANGFGEVRLGTGIDCQLAGLLDTGAVVLTPVKVLP